MTKHTPGTWRTGRKVFRTVYADDKLIGVMDRAEDAALASAGPDMLEALRLMIKESDAGAWSNWAREQARLAVAKAEGKT